MCADQAAAAAVPAAQVAASLAGAVFALWLACWVLLLHSEPLAGVAAAMAAVAVLGMAALCQKAGWVQEAVPGLTETPGGLPAVPVNVLRAPAPSVLRACDALL